LAPWGDHGYIYGGGLADNKKKSGKVKGYTREANLRNAWSMAKKRILKMNKVECTDTTSGGCELVVAGAETLFRHAGSQVSLRYISYFEYKGKPFAPDSWVRTFDSNHFSFHYHQYFYYHQFSCCSALIDVFRVALPISIQSYCPLVSISCHQQTYIKHPCYFPSPVTHTRRERKKRRPEQSKDKGSLLGLN
jgi:hypothetical protein